MKYLLLALGVIFMSCQSVGIQVVTPSPRPATSPDNRLVTINDNIFTDDLKYAEYYFDFAQMLVEKSKEDKARVDQFSRDTQRNQWITGGVAFIMGSILFYSFSKLMKF